jgi:hypothetical protein
MGRLTLVVLLTAAAGCASNRSDEADRIPDTTTTAGDTVNTADTMPRVREGPPDSTGDPR